MASKKLFLTDLLCRYNNDS